MMITSYEELPIGKYQRIIEALKKNEDSIDAHVEMLSILNDMEKSEVYNLPLQDYAAMSEAAAFLLQELPDVNGGICRYYKLGDMTLIPTTDVKKFTAAQYIDYQQMLKEDGRIVELISTLLVPKGKTYADGYDIADVHKAISEHMSVMEAFRMSAFFLRKLKNSINHSLTSLERQMKGVKDRRRMKLMVKLVRHSMKNGDGLTT